jgi:putative membrane protein
MVTSKLLAAAVSFIVAAPAAVAGGRPVFTDAEILGVVGAANQGELDAAERAASKTLNGRVKRFAEAVRKDHEEAKQELVEVEAKASLTPADTELSNSMTKRAADEAGRLESLDGAAFDDAYIGGQVTAHSELLRSIDEDLMPGAKDPSVAALLRRLRPVIRHHLEKARQAQAELRSPRK